MHIAYYLLLFVIVRICFGIATFFWDLDALYFVVGVGIGVLLYDAKLLVGTNCQCNTNADIPNDQTALQICADIIEAARLRNQTKSIVPWTEVGDMNTACGLILKWSVVAARNGDPHAAVEALRQLASWGVETCQLQLVQQSVIAANTILRDHKGIYQWSSVDRENLLGYCKGHLGIIISMCYSSYRGTALSQLDRKLVAACMSIDRPGWALASSKHVHWVHTMAASETRPRAFVCTRFDVVGPRCKKLPSREDSYSDRPTTLERDCDIMEGVDPATATPNGNKWMSSDVYVLFTGTDAMSVHLRTNLMCAQTSFDRARDGYFVEGTAHFGFLDLHRELWQKLKPALEVALRNSTADAHIWLIGHSLGGALATLAAPAVRDLFPNHSVYVSTIGAPRVLDATARQAFAGLDDIIFNRYTLPYDLVPMAVPSLIGYKHVGYNYSLTPATLSRGQIWFSWLSIVTGMLLLALWVLVRQHLLLLLACVALLGSRCQGLFYHHRVDTYLDTLLRNTNAFADGHVPRLVEHCNCDHNDYATVRIASCFFGMLGDFGLGRLLRWMGKPRLANDGHEARQDQTCWFKSSFLLPFRLTASTFNWLWALAVKDGPNPLTDAEILVKVGEFLKDRNRKLRGFVAPG